MILKWRVFGAAALISMGADAAEVDVEAGGVFALSALSSDDLDTDAPATYEVFTRLDVEHLLDNGVEIGGALDVRLQGDNDQRPGFAGRLGDCAPGVADCGTVMSGALALAPQSPSTGLASFGAPLDVGPYGALESAYVYATGGLGEVVAGRDAGAAVRLDARPPSLFPAVSAGSPSLDATGVNLVRSRNDVSGPAIKATYLTPRIIGFRLGVSYTPSAEGRGADWNTRASGDRLAVAELEDVVEGAVSFSRRFRSSGVRLRLGATASFARDASPYAEFGDYEAYGLGVEVERGDLRMGVRSLASNNSWDAGDGDYTAIEAGLIRDFDRVSVGVEYGAAQDALLNLSGETWTTGGTLKVNDRVEIGLGYTISDADLPVIGPQGRISQNAGVNGAYMVLSVRK